MKLFKKIIIFILIQAFLLSNAVFAQGFESTTLSPGLTMNLNDFKIAYDIYSQEILSAAGIDSDLENSSADMFAGSKKVSDLKAGFSSNKSAFILSVFSILLTASGLLAAQPEINNNVFSPELVSNLDFLSSFIIGLMLVGAMAVYRILGWAKKRLASSDKIQFEKSRRNFMKTAGIRGLIGFLILQTGVLAFIRIYDQLKDMLVTEELKPAIIANLNMLAAVYEQLPDNYYAQNKRLFLPMNAQYWQMFLSINPQEAEQAAKIYAEHAKIVLDLYSRPANNIETLSGSELLRLIAGSIEGDEIFIYQKKKKQQTRKDKFKNANSAAVLPDPDNLLSVGAAASIAPILPIARSRPLNQDNKKREPENKNIKEQKIKQEAVSSPNRETVSISDQAKLLSVNMTLLEQINNSSDEQGRTFFSLKQSFDQSEQRFVIRQIQAQEEIEDFYDLLGRDRNFKWRKIFQMTENFRKNPEFADRFRLYGLFTLDAYGQEQQIVAAADYIIREIDGQIMLNGGHIEVLPEARKKFRGLGKILFTKVLSDAFTPENFKLTQGRKFFIAENKGKETDNDPVGFYKKLGFQPENKNMLNGKAEETIIFKLSLDDSIGFLGKEFLNINFSSKNDFSLQSNSLEPIDLNKQENQMISQAI